MPDVAPPPLSPSSPSNALKASVTPPLWFTASLLLTVAVSNVNNFFGYHAPGAVASELQAYYGLSSAQFGLLFTLYSAPNVLLVLLSGLAIDKFGPERTSLVFSFFMLCGMILFALAPQENGHYYLYTGRLLLGFGESLCASIATMLAMFFRDTTLTFAVGFNQAFVQLFGSAAAFYILPRMTLMQASWTTVFVCVLSFVANLAFVYLSWAFPYYKPSYLDNLISEPVSGSPTELNGNEFHFDDIDTRDTDNDVQDILMLPGDGDSLEDEVPLLRSRSPSASAQSNASSNENTPIMQDLTRLFWLVTLMITLLSPALYTFTAYGPLYFSEHWNYTAQQSGAVTSVLYVTIVFSPLSGYLMDIFGYRSEVQACVTLLIPLCYALLTFSDLAPIFGMAALGCVYSVSENLGYAMIAFTVPARRLGLAYSIVACMVSIALLFEPAGVGYLREATGSFYLSNVLFTVTAFAGWLCAITVFTWDRSHDKLMSGPRVDYDEFDQAEESDEDLKAWPPADEHNAIHHENGVTEMTSTAYQQQDHLLHHLHHRDHVDVFAEPFHTATAVQQQQHHSHHHHSHPHIHDSSHASS